MTSADDPKPDEPVQPDTTEPVPRGNPPGGNEPIKADPTEPMPFADPPSRERTTLDDR